MSETGRHLPLTKIAVRAGSLATPVRTELVVGGLAPRLAQRDGSSAQVSLSAAEMLLVDRDVVNIDVSVGAGCTLFLEDIGGTVVYPQRRGARGSGRAEWNVTVSVEEGARLVWNTLPLVIAEKANVLRTLRVQLGHGARALLRETLVLGRSHEVGGRVQSTTNIIDPEGPVLIDDLLANGNSAEPGVLGAHRVYDQVSAAGFRPPAESEHLALEAPGVLARFLGDQTHLSPLDSTFSAWARYMVT